MLHWDVFAFANLRVDVLYEVLALRQLVFVVEQTCAYLDCDGKDPHALHLLGRDVGGRLVTYARLLPPGVSFAEPAIGRVVSHPDVRRTGCGRELMHQAIAHAHAAFGPQAICIGAQVYLRRFYESLGFAATGRFYDEDGIPHLEMRLPPSR